MVLKEQAVVGSFASYLRSPFLWKGKTQVNLAAVQVVCNRGGKPMLIALLYLILGGAYLVVIPALVFVYMQNRWYTCSSVERVFMYFLVFFFFPGMLLLAPFWNFRPKRRQIPT